MGRWLHMQVIVDSAEAEFDARRVVNNMGVSASVGQGVFTSTSIVFLGMAVEYMLPRPEDKIPELGLPGDLLRRLGRFNKKSVPQTPGDWEMAESCLAMIMASAKRWHRKNP